MGAGGAARRIRAWGRAGSARAAAKRQRRMHRASRGTGVPQAAAPRGGPASAAGAGAGAGRRRRLRRTPLVDEYLYVFAFLMPAAGRKRQRPGAPPAQSGGERRRCRRREQRQAAMLRVRTVLVRLVGLVVRRVVLRLGHRGGGGGGGGAAERRRKGRWALWPRGLWLSKREPGRAMAGRIADSFAQRGCHACPALGGESDWRLEQQILRCRPVQRVNCCRRVSDALKTGRTPTAFSKTLHTPGFEPGSTAGLLASHWQYGRQFTGISVLSRVGSGCRRFLS